MKMVLKFELPQTAKYHEILLMDDAKILMFDEQCGRLYAWIETAQFVSPTQGQPRRFCVVGTGHSIPNEWVHRGSCQVDPFVWHLYEVPLN